MSETQPLRHGHVIVVVTPSPEGRPTYRGYAVAEDDPLKAHAIVARHLRTDETAHALAAFPGTLLQISDLEPGGVMRL